MSDDNTDRLTHPEKKGETTADYLEELLNIASPNGDIEIDVENGRASTEIVADDPDTLDHPVGDNGKVLNALQELTHLTVQTETGERSHLMLDIASFRAEHKEELWGIARKTIVRVRTTGEAAKLDTVSPFECKVCHGMVADGGFTSESEGAESHHRMVILPEDTDGK